MKINVNKVTANSNGLYLGLELKYSDMGPVRFAQVSLEDDVLDWEALQGLAKYVVRQLNRHLDRENDLSQETFSF